MTEQKQKGFSRRTFLKTSALLGGSVLLMNQLPKVFETPARAQHSYLTPTEEYALARPENILYSVCQQCNTQCGIKVKISDGVIAKIDGNPYNPWTMVPHLPYQAPLSSAAPIDGAICPKGQAGLQTTYDPYRLVKVLKRKPGTKRGANQWVTTDFHQAITEIVEGGDLFGEGPVPGLRELWALRDPKVSQQMADFVKKIWAEKDTTEKQKLVNEFKLQFKDHLHTLIDPNHPDLGPKNNQLAFVWGRVKGGRGDLIRRFTQESFGSVNAHGHTTVCQGSLYFACKAMSEQYELSPADKKYKWTKGRKFYWQADVENSEFVIFVGASPFEGNYGPSNRAPRITEGLASGRLKIAVIDPRLSKLAAKAWKWVPALPGTEGAFALALIRWIIENRRYDKRYLENANKAAAKADKEPTWSNATWLVKLDKNGTPESFLRAQELGLTEEERFVVLGADGQPKAVDPYDDGESPVEGILHADTELSGIRVKSAFQLLYESASAHTLEEWGQICGVRERDIIELAREFTAHGKKVAVDIHRGVSQHTNGFYNVLAWMTLNVLVGNLDWAGGASWAQVYDYLGSKEGQPFPVAHPAKMTPFGVSMIRHEVKYEDTTLFTGYPAKRPWYPFSSDIYQEEITSAGDAYPYPIKALFLYMGSPVYSLPAGHTNIEILADPKRIPLVVASDIVIGETSMYADYIFPDLTNLERWEFTGTHPSMTVKVQGVRQPTIAPLTETVKVFGVEQPLSLETLILEVAERLGLPGFGPGGLGEGRDFRHQDDFYLPMVANLAFGERADGSDAVPDADDEELQLFLQARRHLPTTVFDPARWQRIVGERWWRKVVYVLNRGGRFQDYAKAFSDGQLTNRYGKLVNIYLEKVAKGKDSMTGKPYPGLAVYLPAPVDVLDNPVTDDGYDLRLITYREQAHTKSRTVSNYWLLALLPENFVLINAQDAAARGLKDGDRVKIVSASNPKGVWDLKNGKKIPMVGKVKVVQGVRPGVIAFSLGHGHWAYGGTDVVIDGQVIKGEGRRNTGIHANAAMRVDPVLQNTCLVDKAGGSAVFYDTRVKVVKIMNER